MYTATILITIQEFVPMTGIFAQSPSITATISPPTDTSPPTPTPATFSGDGQSITITVPPAYPGSVQLTYQLPDPRYTLLGIAYKASTAGSGRAEFPQVILQRDVTGSQMIVTDDCLNAYNQVVFDYVILVQDVASSNMGLIDPDIETDDGGH